MPGTSSARISSTSRSSASSALSDGFLGRFFVVQNASDSNEIARESDEVVADFVDGILDALARGGRDALVGSMFSLQRWTFR